MKLFKAWGTLGDTYIHVCRLSNFPKDKIRVYHHTRHHFWEGDIRKIYEILPNVAVRFVADHPKDLRLLDHVKVQEYMNFTISKDVSEYGLPKKYTAVVLKSGRPMLNFRVIKESAREQILAENEQIVLIGDKSSPKLAGKNVLDLTGKTTVRGAMEVVRQASKFYGIQGVMSFVATSHRVPSWLYYASGSDLHAIDVNIRQCGWGDSIKDVRKA